MEFITITDKTYPIVVKFSNYIYNIIKWRGGKVMLEMHEKSEAKFSMHFGGEKEIDLRTLITSLDGTVELINNVANAQDKDAFVKINVTGTREGSFVIDLAAIASTAHTLLTKENVNFAKTCIDSVCGLFTIKKHLRGENPKKIESSGDNVAIENVHAEKIEVNVNTYNLYTEDNDKVISKIFTNCNRDYVKVEDGGGREVFIDKIDFDNMRKKISLDDTIEEQIIVNAVKTNLTIKRPDLTGNSQWDLVYSRNGNQKIIKATIEDKKFLYDVHNAKISVNAKTSISVELETTVRINEIGETDKQLYAIKKVFHVYQDDNTQISFLEN